MRAHEVQNEEERKAQEAHEDERRTQEAREDEERRAQEQEAREDEIRGQEKRREEEREVEAQEGHEGKEEMTTQGECVVEKKETNSVQEEHDVSNRHMTWWKTHGGSVWTADHTCGRREGVDESGEQPEGRPNRPAMKTGSNRPSVKPKRQKG